MTVNQRQTPPRVLFGALADRPAATGAGLQVGDLYVANDAGPNLYQIVQDATAPTPVRSWVQISPSNLGPANIAVSDGAGASGQINVTIHTTDGDVINMWVMDSTDGSNITPSKVGGTAGTELGNSGAASPATAQGLTATGGGTSGQFVERFTGTTLHNYMIVVSSSSRPGSIILPGMLP